MRRWRARPPTAAPAVLIGTPWVEEGKLYNAYALLAGGGVEAIRYKVNLPNYGVFDEKRVFASGPVPGPVSFRGVRLGLPICEDTWTDWGDYENVVECLAETGAELLIVPNGSPYWRDKAEVRLNVTVARVTEAGLPLLYINQVGGQDELVFDGASFALNVDRSIALQLPAFRETVITTHWSRTQSGWRCAQGPVATAEEEDQADYNACMLGLRDYVDKNRFHGVVIGLSGGVDSALCAVLAIDAIGADRVRCVMLPYRFTSQESLDDAAAIAGALGLHYDTVPIESAVQGLEASLTGIFGAALRDVTEENLQARARGTILMAISNKFGLMVVTTGNKSEMSVGYATLYGDMNGGFNPIKDLYKTEVYRLARLRNVWKPDGALGPDGRVIVDNVLTRAPSAELRENQTDQDSLPPYDVLDQILAAAGRARGAARRHHRRGFRSRHGDEGRPHAQSRGVQAPASRARREGDAEEFWPGPALSDHQPVSRSRHGAAGARRRAEQKSGPGRGRRRRSLIARCFGLMRGDERRSDRAHRTLGRIGNGDGFSRDRRCHHRGWRRRGAGLGRLCAFRQRGLRRLREGLCVLVGDDDVAAFERRRIVGILERIGPALARPPARAGGCELFAILEGRRQSRVGLAAERNRLVDVLAGISIRVELGLGGGTLALTGALVVREFVRHRRIRNREIISVAGPHADRPERAGRRAIAAGRDDVAVEQRVEEAGRSRRLCGGAILRSAIVLRQRSDELPALAFLVAVVAALETLEIAHRAIEIVAHLLDLGVQWLAFRRLAGE